MIVRWVDDVDARVAIGELIGSLLSSDGFGASVDEYARSDAYTFLISFADDGPDDTLADARAVAVLSVYELPMASRVVLGVDGMALRGDLEAALGFLRVLAEIASAADMHGVLIAEGGVAKPGLVEALAGRGHLDTEPVGVVRPWMMRRASAGAWSPFAAGPIPDRVFEAVPCLCIVTEDLTVDPSGEEYSGAGPLYRGEGRLRCDGWDCGTLDDVAAHLRRVGFVPRSDASFGGTVVEQILHQGYVRQGTVSLSSSFDVCAYYATYRGERPAGVVFTVDADRLRAHGAIWDTYATLARHCDWFFAAELETLATVVDALGVKDAGRFLERCHAGTRQRVVEGSAGFEPIDWDTYVDGGLDRLQGAGIEEEPLASLHNALEAYWGRALGQIAAEDVIHVGGGTETRRLGVLAYEQAFLEAERRLASDPHVPPDPGWDMTAFGYIAKTCRDREYLCTGPVPPDCIVAATIVSAGRRR